MSAYKWIFSQKSEKEYSAVSVFISFLFLVLKFLLSWLFCAVLISLGYWWGVSEDGASECQTLPSKVLDTAPNPKEGLGELGVLIVLKGEPSSLGRWLIDVTSPLPSFGTSHSESVTQSWRGFAAEAGPASDSVMCHILSAGNLHSWHQSSWSWQENFWRGVGIW